MCVVPVKLRHGDSGETLKTYALLDSCSQGTFILERLLKRFGIKGKKTSINIKTLNGEVTNKSSVINGLIVASSRNSSEDWLELPDTYTKKYLPVGKEDVATTSKLKWDTQNDTLGFYIKFADKLLTRHGLLSTLSSVYDPLGLAAPFLLKGTDHSTVVQKQVELG